MSWSIQPTSSRCEGCCRAVPLQFPIPDETQVSSCVTGNNGDLGRPTLADVEKLLQPMSAPAKASTYTFTMF